METITVPALDDNRVLRHVEIDGRYRLLVWDTYRTGRHGGETLGYAFSRIGESEPIFAAEDFGAPAIKTRGESLDGDATLRSLLSFLTLREGDTDSDYFAGYTERQWAFSRGDAEEISMWAMDPESGSDPLPFVEIE